MRCDEALLLFHLVESGEASPDEASAFEAHRAVCPACRTALASEARALTAYRRARPAPALPAGARERLLRALPPARPAARPRPIRLRFAAALSAAAAALLVFTILRLPVEDPGRQTLPPDIRAVTPGFPRDEELARLVETADSDLAAIDALLAIAASPSASAAEKGAAAPPSDSIWSVFDAFTQDLEQVTALQDA